MKIRRKISTVVRRQRDRCEVCGSELGERKAAMLWRGGNSFQGKEMGEREREWFRESNIHSHKKKTSQTTKWGVGRTDQHRFFANNECHSNSELLERRDFHQSGAIAPALGEKDVCGPRHPQVVQGSSGSLWEISFPFLEYNWKRVSCPSRDERPCRYQQMAFLWHGKEVITEGI